MLPLINGMPELTRATAMPMGEEQPWPPVGMEEAAEDATRKEAAAPDLLGSEAVTADRDLRRGGTGGEGECDAASSIGRGQPQHGQGVASTAELVERSPGTR
jgi:hypothetical protein